MKNAKFIVWLALVLSVGLPVSCNKETSEGIHAAKQIKENKAVNTLTILNKQGYEILFILNKGAEIFNQYYLFQYTDPTQVFEQQHTYTLVFASEKTLTIRDNETSKTILFSIETEGSADVFGYGLSFTEGEFTLSSDFNVIPIAEKGLEIPKPDDVDCNSGGEGATDCSISNAAGHACNISCGEGYFACCTRITYECKCFDAKTGKPVDTPEDISLQIY